MLIAPIASIAVVLLKRDLFAIVPILSWGTAKKNRSSA
jgi:hypothetical protein